MKGNDLDSSKWLERLKLLCTKRKDVERYLSASYSQDAIPKELSEEIILEAYVNIEKLGSIDNMDGWLFGIVDKKMKGKNYMQGRSGINEKK